MWINKKKVQKNFSAAAANYDRISSLQQEIIRLLLPCFPISSSASPFSSASSTSSLSSLSSTFSPPLPSSFKANRILDIGTGTGKLLFDLTRAFPSADLYGMDLAYGMINRACRMVRECSSFSPSTGAKFPLFLQADAEKLPYRSESFNLVLSNLVYQWVPDLGQAFREAYRVLKPRGRFFFSTFGHGTLTELHTSFQEAYRKLEKETRRGDHRETGEETLRRDAHRETGKETYPEAYHKTRPGDETHQEAHRKPGEDTPQSHGQPFFTPQELEATLKCAGFLSIMVRECAIPRAYPDVRSLLLELKATGASNATLSRSAGLGSRRILKEMSRYYEQHFQNAQEGILATYQVILAQGEKK